MADFTENLHWVFRYFLKNRWRFKNFEKIEVKRMQNMLLKAFSKSYY